MGDQLQASDLHKRYPDFMRPTEDQCWRRFWDVVTPAIVEGVREGRITQADYDRGEH